MLQRSTLAWFVFLAGMAQPALAGPYGDDMAKCLVASTTADDKTALVQWMFATSTLHPAVKAMSTVTDPQRQALNKRFADIAQTLLTKTCLTQSRDAIRYEGLGTIEASFTILGQVAGRALFADPAVAAGMKDLEKYFDAKRVQEVLGVKQ